MNETKAKALIEKELQYAYKKHPDDHESLQMSEGIIILEIVELIEAIVKYQKVTEARHPPYASVVTVAYQAMTTECAQVIACCYRLLKQWFPLEHYTIRETAMRREPPKHPYSYLAFLYWFQGRPGDKSANSGIYTLMNHCYTLLLNVERKG